MNMLPLSLRERPFYRTDIMRLPVTAHGQDIDIRNKSVTKK